MRGIMLISGVVLVTLASCGEHRGWNPNYGLGSGKYGQYLTARETALVSNTTSPSKIPITLPAESPTPTQIAGRKTVPVPYHGVVVKRVVGAPLTNMPVTTTGPYPGSTPVLVRYALSVKHGVGTPVWPRTTTSVAQERRVCATFATPDAAQTAFLAAGGPQRDQRLMDPDGDGFVCRWDPAPFRQPGL